MRRFGHREDLRFCLRVAVSTAREAELSTAVPDSVPSAGVGQLYLLVEQAQTIAGFEEVPRSKLLALRAVCALERPSYNRDDVERLIHAARSAAVAAGAVSLGACGAVRGVDGASARALRGGEGQRAPAKGGGKDCVTTAATGCLLLSDQEADELERLLASTEFKLAARSYLPDSNTEVLALLNAYRRRRALVCQPGFFDALADVAEACAAQARAGRDGSGGPLAAAVSRQCLVMELDCRTAHDGPGSNGCQPSLVAQSYRQLIDQEMDNEAKLQWLQRALAFVQERGGAEYPLDELSWLAATAWNCGLAIQKTGGRAQGERFHAAAIKLAQTHHPSGTVVRADELDAMMRWYSECAGA